MLGAYRRCMEILSLIPANGRRTDAIFRLTDEQASSYKDEVSHVRVGVFAWALAFDEAADDVDLKRIVPLCVLDGEVVIGAAEAHTRFERLETSDGIPDVF